MMKKVLLFVACVSIAFHAMAFPPSSENKDFVESLTNFFAARGIDVKYEISDNSLNFKIGDNSYWVCVYNDKAPYLIDFHKEGVKMQPGEREADLLKRCNEVNCEIMAGKAFLMANSQNRKYVNFTTQYFICDRKEFVEVYNKSIEVLDALEAAYKSKTAAKK